MAGSSTTHGNFYKPSYGASGEAEKNLFDAALDSADAQIEANKNAIEEGVAPSKTTAQIQAICTAGNDSTVRIFFNTTRGTLEMWYGKNFAKPL